MYSRREFIQTMVAAGALPAFLGPLAPGVQAAISPKLLEVGGDNTKLIVTGMEWFAGCGFKGNVGFPECRGGPIYGTNLWIDVDINYGETVWDSVSVIHLMSGKTLMFRETVQGRVEAVYVHHRKNGRYLSTGGAVK